MDVRLTQDFSGRAIIEATPGTIAVERVETTPTKIGIPCLLCGKVLETEMGSHCFYPYICDECKEAVAYAKQLKTKAEHDPLEAILD